MSLFIIIAVTVLAVSVVGAGLVALACALPVHREPVIERAEEWASR